MNSYRNMKIIRGILLAVTIACLVLLGQAYYSSFRQRQQAKALKEMREMIEPEPLEIAQESAVPENGSVPEEAGEPVEELPTEPEEPLLEKYAALYEENHDLAGWLSIEGMVID